MRRLTARRSNCSQTETQRVTVPSRRYACLLRRGTVRIGQGEQRNSVFARARRRFETAEVSLAFSLSCSLFVELIVFISTIRANVTVQQSLVHLFLTRFTLTDAELRVLNSRDVPVGPELFAAMDKTERIRADCRALLSGEAGEGTKAG